VRRTHERALGVIARPGGLGHRRRALRVQSGKEHRLTCALGTGGVGNGAGGRQIVSEAWPSVASIRAPI
jgi:hypothetical protein